MLTKLKKFNDYSINEREVAKDVHNLTGILDTNIDWYGEDKGNKSSFYEDFTQPKWSVRATFINLYAYKTKFNESKINDIILRWRFGKPPDAKLTSEEQKDLDIYYATLNKVGIEPGMELKYEGDIKFADEANNYTTLFKLVKGIILQESGQLDSDDLNGFKSLDDLVVGAFEAETNDEKSKPAYKKLQVDINSEEYKKGKAAFLGKETVAKTEEKEENKEVSKTTKLDNFKKILKDFK